jgi:CcmD family protein
MARVAAVLSLLAVLLTPVSAFAQAPPIGGPYRSYVHVLIAFGVAWLMVAVWVFRIGRRVSRIARELEAVAGSK